MFLALLVWTFSADLHFFFGHMAIFKEIEDDKRLVLSQFSRNSAREVHRNMPVSYVGNICLTFLFFPVTRTSSVLPLLGLTMFLFTAHGSCYIVYWALTNCLSSKEFLESSSIFVIFSFLLFWIREGFFFWLLLGHMGQECL
ncbi:hypothetical protein AgCh_039535 [Apium graveolens]